MPLEKDKCNLCALKVIFDQDAIHGDAEKTENFLNLLHELQKEGIIDPGHNRRIYASNTGEGDKSEMCALNLEFFLPANRKKRCPDFILNMDLRAPEALALNTARSTDRLTAKMHKLTLIIFGLTFLSVMIGIVAIICA
jgi:hypothetical protein